uniref:Uncharacterized protein n=1 Tax=Arundo donax TaxID=35708 RepID=A0A0A9BVL7_ARUDO
MVERRRRAAIHGGEGARGTGAARGGTAG